MRKLGLDRLYWRKDSLFFLTEQVMSVVPDKIEEKMFRVKYPDGTFSKDYYNHTRAKDHAMNEYIRMWNRGDLNNNATQPSL